jgi:hypothetical protein
MIYLGIRVDAKMWPKPAEPFLIRSFAPNNYVDIEQEHTK